MFSSFLQFLQETVCINMYQPSSNIIPTAWKQTFEASALSVSLADIDNIFPILYARPLNPPLRFQRHQMFGHSKDLLELER